MEQRDLIKDQIEQLGKVLSRILSEFLGLKSKGQVTQGIINCNQSLQSELDLDVAEIGNLTKGELKIYLKHRKLTSEHLEVLSEYFKEIGKAGKKANHPQAQLWLIKAIELLEIADEFSRTLSLDRLNKKTEIEKEF